MAADTTPAVASAATPVDVSAFIQGLVRDLNLKQLELPGFPVVVVRLHRALADQNSSVKDISQLVVSDPALAARMVQLANSAAFNSSGREISDLRAAITHLGFNVVRSQATTFAMRQMENLKWLQPIGPQLAEIWKTSNNVAAISSAVARRIDGVQPDEALATGLFHLLGKLYIYTRALRDGVAAGEIVGWESAINDWHPVIARAILDNWGIPAKVAEAVENQNALFDTDAGDLPLLPRILAAAKLACRLKGPADAQTAERQALLDKVRLGRESFVEVMTRWQQEIEATERAMA
jgi:HD-like signal output (HDOD) protein